MADTSEQPAPGLTPEAIAQLAAEATDLHRQEALEWLYEQRDYWAMAIAVVEAANKPKTDLH